MLAKWMRDFCDYELENFSINFDTAKDLVIPDETFMKNTGNINV